MSLPEVIFQLILPRERIVATDSITSTTVLWTPEGFLLDSVRAIVVP
jgi:hypothetical protein